MERWAEYFERLLNVKEPEETFNFTQEEPNICGCVTPTLQEIKTQIKRLRNHKSTGENGIQGKILKCMDQAMVENVHKLIEETRKTEDIPEDWNLALICLDL